MVASDQVNKKFFDLFKTEPILVRAPGRINLIGEHTDYNDGFVMPAAIDREIIFAIAPSQEKLSTIHALDFNDSITINLHNLHKVDKPMWANYLLGVLDQYIFRGIKLKNFNCVFAGNIPTGAGLSSSAAVETGFAFAIQELNRLNLPKIDLIKIGQWSEHHYVGVQCGIMDQFASVMGKEGHVILLDCRDLSYQYLPFDLNGHAIVLCDSKVKHKLVDSDYNRRRNECEEGVALLKRYYPSVNSLRDVDSDMLEKHRPEFSGKVYTRCLYVVEELKRVQSASEDLKRSDLKSFGKKMFETHRGLSEKYEVSCTELDFLVDEAKKNRAVLGSRMMGGGFGGCTINIIEAHAVDRFINETSRAYKEKFSIDMQPMRVNITEGTSVVR